MARRGRNQWKRALGFFLLAALTLLVAGVIARTEVPALMKSRIDVPRWMRESVQARAFEARTRAPVEAPRRPLANADTASNQAHASAGSASHGEEIKDAERQQLGALIRERSR